MTNFIKERQFRRNSAVLTVARGYCHNATYLSPGSLCRTNITVQWNVHFIRGTFPYTYIPAEIKATGFTESYIEVL